MIDKKLSSGKKTDNALIYTGPCYYYGFVCASGKAKLTITIYDGVAAAGTVVEYYITDANKEMDGHEHANPVVCSDGLYLALGGGTAIVYYVPQGTY